MAEELFSLFHFTFHGPKHIAKCQFSERIILFYHPSPTNFTKTSFWLLWQLKNENETVYEFTQQSSPSEFLVSAVITMTMMIILNKFYSDENFSFQNNFMSAPMKGGSGRLLPPHLIFHVSVCCFIFASSHFSPEHRIFIMRKSCLKNFFPFQQLPATVFGPLKTKQ